MHPDSVIIAQQHPLTLPPHMATVDFQFANLKKRKKSRFYCDSNIIHQLGNFYAFFHSNPSSTTDGFNTLTLSQHPRPPAALLNHTRETRSTRETPYTHTHADLIMVAKKVAKSSVKVLNYCSWQMSIFARRPHPLKTRFHVHFLPPDPPTRVHTRLHTHRAKDQRPGCGRRAGGTAEKLRAWCERTAVVYHKRA